MEFVAIDVETANADVSSICQVGIATYVEGEMTREWKSYVDPEDYFDGMNVAVHGITEKMVKGAPTFPEIYSIIEQSLGGRIAVCHTHFDRVSVKRAAEKYDLIPHNCTWLDTARVARRAWRDKFAQSGYGLANVCSHLGYEFNHHDALEDAKAAGHILINAVRETGIEIKDWLKRVEQSIWDADPKGCRREGNPEGPLHGEVIVFTGALQIPRREASDLAANAGCDVVNNVSKKTTLLVVGDQDISKLAGASKSSKHRKAELLIEKGHAIRVIGESVFHELMANEF